SLGHKVGDTVLESVAQRFRGCIAGVDTLARFGGDEFAVLVPDLENNDRAAAIAHRLIQRLRTPISVPGVLISVGVSIGVALYPRDGADVESVLQGADR